MDATVGFSRKKVNKKLFKPNGEVDIEVGSSIDSAQFFKTCDCVWFTSNFPELFTGGANSLCSGVFSLSKHILKRDLSSPGIRKELFGGKIFQAEEFCQVIIALLMRQWFGEIGVLNNRGYAANIFFVWDKNNKEYYTVDVSWCPDDMKWSIDVRKFESSDFYFNDVVFSYN